jgi:hypothetical protein
MVACNDNYSITLSLNVLVEHIYLLLGNNNRVLYGGILGEYNSASGTTR